MIDFSSRSDRPRLRLVARGVAPSAEREPAVRQMVRKQLQRPRWPSDAALYGRAVRIDPGVRALTVREFLDRYVRPETRRRKRAQGGGRSRGTETARRPRGSTNGRRKDAPERREAARLAARETLVQVAREAAAASSRVEVIDLLESIDRHAEHLAEHLQSLR